MIKARKKKETNWMYSQQIRIYLNIKAIYDKPITNITLDNGSLKVLPLR